MNPRRDIEMLSTELAGGDPPAPAATSRFAHDEGRDVLFPAAGETFADFMVARWRDTCAGLGLSRWRSRASAAKLRSLLSPWGNRRIGVVPPYRSFVSHDGFPAELSVRWRNGEPEIRVLFESLDANPGDGPVDAASTQRAGVALGRRLADERGTDLDNYGLVAGLFLTDEPEAGRPTVWHSIAWRPGSVPTYKVYLNPQVRGVTEAPPVVEEALGRLGLGAAWRPVARHRAELAVRGDEVDFFALDLESGPGSRAKVYFRHHDLPLDELDLLPGLTLRHDREAAADAYRQIYGDTSVVANHPMTCLAFRTGYEAPVEASVYLRLPGNTRSEAEAAERIGRLLPAAGADGDSYRELLGRLCPRPLEEAYGFQELVSYRTTGAGTDVTVYLRFGVYETTE